jgi:branched-subunit amino acid aminotransferase/4-amino-4-deoxychorismate lyase
MVCELAESIEQPIEFAAVQPSDLIEAMEVLMTGSTGCLWSAVSVNGIPIGEGRPGQLCVRLQKAWHQKIGFDFIEQALTRSR